MRGRHYTLAGWLNVLAVVVVCGLIGAALGRAPAFGGISGGGGGEWVLVERQAVSAVAAVTFSGLTGDADKVYELTYRVNTSTAQTITLEPNGLATNMSTQRVQWLNNAASALEDTTLAIIGAPAADDVIGTARFWAATGQDRGGHFTSASADDGSSQVEMEFGVLHWRESSTAITSLEFQTSTGTVTGTVSLFKLAQGD